MSDDPLDLDTGLPARIATDAAVLAPLTLSVARRLLASADTDGVCGPITRRSRASLASMSLRSWRRSSSSSAASI